MRDRRARATAVDKRTIHSNVRAVIGKLYINGAAGFVIHASHITNLLLGCLHTLGRFSARSLTYCVAM